MKPKFCSAIALAICTLIGVAAAQPAEPKPEVAGVTLDSKGETLRKVELTLFPLDGGTATDPMPPFVVVSSKDGKFAFYQIPDGRYRLVAERAGYLRAVYGAQHTWAPGGVLIVRAGKPIENVELRMQEQSTISGTVARDETVTNVIVSLLQRRFENGQSRLVTVTRVYGTGFNKLLPGRYYVAASAIAIEIDPKQQFAVTYYPGTLEPREAEVIEVKRGESRTGIQMALRRTPAFRVTGTVTEQVTGPRTIVSLRPNDTLGPLSPNSVISAMAINGAFELSGVLPGAYWLSVTAGTPPISMPPQMLEVTNSDVTGIQLKAEAAMKIDGAVRMEGAPGAFPSLRLSLTPVAGLNMVSPSAIVQKDGSFSISAPPGPYRIELVGLPGSAYLKSVMYGDQNALAALELKSGADPMALAIVISSAAAKVTGVVRNDQNKPVAGVVTLIPDPRRPDQPSLYQMVEATASGVFEIEGVRPGKYRLYAWEELEPGAHFDPQTTAAHQASGVPVEVGENESKEFTLTWISLEKMQTAAPRSPR